MDFFFQLCTFIYIIHTHTHTRDYYFYLHHYIVLLFLPFRHEPHLNPKAPFVTHKNTVIYILCQSII